MVDVHETKKVALHRIVLQDERPAFMSLRWDDAIEAYNQMPIPRQREFVRVIEEYSGRSKKARELLLRALRERGARAGGQRYLLPDVPPAGEGQERPERRERKAPLLDV